MNDKAAAIPTEEISDEAIMASMQALLEELEQVQAEEDELEYLPSEDEEVRLADLIR